MVSLVNGFELYIIHDFEYKFLVVICSDLQDFLYFSGLFLGYTVLAIPKTLASYIKLGMRAYRVNLNCIKNSNKDPMKEEKEFENKTHV